MDTTSSPKPKCVNIGCNLDALHHDRNRPDRTFCSQECFEAHKEMLSDQIKRDHPLYNIISSYYRGSYQEDKDYTELEFHGFCYQMSEEMRDYYVVKLLLPMPELSYNSFKNALVDTYKSNKDDRALLVKSIIGSFMNFVFVLINAMDKWRENDVPEITRVTIVSLFQWMTFEQGINEIKRWMPTATSPRVVLFRAATRMSKDDPYINMPNTNYSSTLVRMFPITEGEAARQRRIRQEDGKILNYNIYAIRSFGSESNIIDFSFLTKAKDLGAEKVLVSKDKRLELLDLKDLHKSATLHVVYMPNSVPWSG